MGNNSIFELEKKVEKENDPVKLGNRKEKTVEEYYLEIFRHFEISGIQKVLQEKDSFKEIINHDFIELTDNSIKYKDNQHENEITYDRIVKAERLRKNIKLSFSEGPVLIIYTSQMNFNKSELNKVLKEISKKLNPK